MRRLFALIACAWLGGCAQLPGFAPAAPVAPLFVDAAFAPPEHPVLRAEVFALSPDMRRWLATDVAAAVQEHGLPKGLVDSLYTNQSLALVYDAEFTRNAAETFAARAGNCLSLVVMTGAFARELGLTVRYQSVQVEGSWGRDGDLLEYMGHVNVVIGRPIDRVRPFEIGSEAWTIDFDAAADSRHTQATLIDESRVVAMYMNNKAAEALARRHPDEAYWWMRAAIAADPGWANLYNTLGLVYLRKGLTAQAENVLRHAVAREPDNRFALNNLAVALRRLDRPAEADVVLARLATLRARSPFDAFDRGMAAYTRGDYPQARVEFERALHGSIDYHEFHFWLAATWLQLGDREQALAHLRQAEANSNTRSQQVAYAAKIERLKGLAPSVQRVQLSM